MVTGGGTASVSPVRRVRASAPLLVLATLTAVLAGCDRRSPDPVPKPTHTSEAVTLAGPADADGSDLDLHLHWRAARVRQVVPRRDHQWTFRQYSDLVVIDGEAHRALLLLPSSDGTPSRASFSVALAAEGDPELITWISLQADAAPLSDGVEFGIGIAPAEADPDTIALKLERLSRDAGVSAWRELRVDLSAYRGQTVWIVLAALEQHDRAGDWLLWGDPRIRSKDHPTRPAVIDVAAPKGPARARRVPWSETNVFKPYALFRDREVSSAVPEWVARSFPWLDSLRLFSALGANWGPTLEREYDAQMGKNPTTDNRWEARAARSYEFFQDGPAWNTRPLRERFAWGEFDRLIDALAGSGLALHLNLAGAPEAFTGHAGHYETYHFNEMPIVDEAGWKTYVATLFTHLASRPWFPRAQISFFNEPNCRWTEADGRVRRFGYQGDAEAYARQYLWTWQAMKPYVHPGQIHLGPYVAEPDRANPITDNLPEFLRALRETFAASGEPLPPWSSFAVNVYDTPQLTLDGLAATKLAYVRAVLDEELPGLMLPLRFDEVGLHPIITSVFAASGAGVLDETRWAASWNAEMLALLLEQGIERASPWSSVYSHRSFAPYFFASFVAHAVTYRVTPEHEIEVERVLDRSAAPESLSARLATTHADRIGALWSVASDARSVRIALWRYPRFAMSDTRLARDRGAQRVEVRLPDSSRAWRVRIIGDAEQQFPPALDPGAQADAVATVAAKTRRSASAACRRFHRSPPTSSPSARA